MTATKPLVVVGLLGTQLDAGTGPRRWDRWRPTVSLCQHDDIAIARLELIAPPSHMELARTVRDDIAGLAPDVDVRLHAVAFDDPWAFDEVFDRLLAWAQAYPFRPEDEDYLFHITTGTHVAQICIFLLAEARYLPGRLAQTSPPRSRDEWPAGTLRIIDLNLARYDRLARRFSDERIQRLGFLKSGIETRNAAFNALVDRLEKVALRSREPILFLGPTGSGKSRLAAQVHLLRKSRRMVDGPLVEVNCATIRGDGAMSTLFGHARGAFTGAVAAREGMLRAAHGGTLFLDEIGELGADEQAMLLRALETQRFLPVGADREVTSAFLLVAGTNRDLVADARSGRFRADLLARVDVWTFSLPSLRERAEDIEPNLSFELDRASRALGANVTMTSDARDAFLRFATSPDAAWEGNFRDLAACVLRMATLADGGRISADDVGREADVLRGRWRGTTPRAEVPSPLQRLLSEDAMSQLDRFDLMQLEGVLRVCTAAPSLSAAGRHLFGVSRATRASVNDADRLRKYLLRFGIRWEDVEALRSAPHFLRPGGAAPTI